MTADEFLAEMVRRANLDQRGCWKGCPVSGCEGATCVDVCLAAECYGLVTRNAEDVFEVVNGR